MKKLYKRILVIALIILLIIIAAVVLINLYIIKSTENRIVPADKTVGGYDCILVLGAGVKDDGTPSAMLKERLECALKLYKNGVSEKILVSGDHGTDEYDEVNTMKDWLKNAGVPPENIFMDHAGFSTYDSIYRAAHVFEVKKACIVTQKYHLYRALYLAEKLGIESVGTDAMQIRYGGQEMRDAREAAARIKDFFSGIFLPKPKYLGDTIPVYGSGEATDDN